MANSVFKLKVETSEYDANIKKAAEGIQHLAAVAHKADGELTGLDKAEIEYLKALGDMPTKSKSAAGSTRELESAFKELTVIYNNLSDVEKADEGGKALAASLDKLKQRAQDARQQLEAAGDQLQTTSTTTKESGGLLDKLAQKFVVNIDAIKLFNVGLQAAEGALSVAKDAFFASEATVDEWGRTMDAGKSLYQGFLTALNTGDISGYLDRIDDIVKAARTAYDELDRLGTMKRIQAPQISAQQTENERMRMMVQTGRYIAPMDGRRNAVFNGKVMQNGDLLSPGQIRAIERQLQGGMNKAVGLIGNEVKQTSRAINALYDRQAKELGLSKKEFMAGTSSMAEFDKRIAGYQQYRSFEREHTTYDSRSGISHRDNVANPYAAFKSWGVFRVDGDRYNELVQLLTQRDQQTSQAYGMQSQAYRVINRAEGITTRKLLGGGSGGAGGAGGAGNVTKEITHAADSIAAQQALVSALSKEWSEAGADVRNSYLTQLIEAEKVLKRMKVDAAMFRENSEGRLLERGPIQTTDLGMVTGSFKKTKVEGLSPKLLQQGNALKKIADDNAQSWQGVASAIGTVGAAMNSIEDPAARVAGMIAQAVATIALTFSKSLAGTVTPWDWIAGAAAGTATMISTIAALHSATGYAQGGIVKGNSYSGDNIGAVVDGSQLVGLNAGEVVLTKAMQNNLAGQLQGSGLQNLHLEATVTGSQIKLALKNDDRLQGGGSNVIFKS